jgi:hypothetical protein
LLDGVEFLLCEKNRIRKVNQLNLNEGKLILGRKKLSLDAKKLILHKKKLILAAKKLCAIAVTILTTTS